MVELNQWCPAAHGNRLAAIQEKMTLFWPDTLPQHGEGPRRLPHGGEAERSIPRSMPPSSGFRLLVAVAEYPRHAHLARSRQSLNGASSTRIFAREVMELFPPREGHYPKRSEGGAEAPRAPPCWVLTTASRGFCEHARACMIPAQDCPRPHAVYRRGGASLDCGRHAQDSRSSPQKLELFRRRISFLSAQYRARRFVPGFRCRFQASASRRCSTPGFYRKHVRNRLKPGAMAGRKRAGAAT